jgi:tetratricopeptide (TPR) repeat protein
MNNFDLKKYLAEGKLFENSISRNIENITIENGWESWDDVENEIENIREKFNLMDSTSRYDEAYDKFEQIYNINPLDIKKYLAEGKLNERISFEAIERMEELANIQDLETLKAKLRILSSDWMNEGFEKEDIIDYMAYLIDNI